LSKTRVGIVKLLPEISGMFKHPKHPRSYGIVSYNDNNITSVDDEGDNEAT